MSTIYILLPVYNRKEITRQFIECLKKQTFSDYYLILIDDGSTDGTTDMVKEYISPLTVLYGNGNLWWAGCLQKGLDWLKNNAIHDNSLILIINDDVTFPADYLKNAVFIMKQKKGCLVLSQFLSDNNQAIETGIYANWRNFTFETASNKSKINCLSTRGLFIYWKDICTIGNLYPNLLPHYLSDYEYTIRANRKGLICETNSSLLIKPNHETTGLHTINEDSIIKFFNIFFSKKHSNNPIYWTSFVLTACKPIWIIPNLFRIWARACYYIIRSIKL